MGIVGMKPVNIESRTDEAGNGQLPRAPLVARRDHAEPSLFLPENLLREALMITEAPGIVPPLVYEYVTAENANNFS